MTSVSEPSSLDEAICSVSRDTNFETYSLLWLDASINSEENLNAQEQLRFSINYLQTFNKLDECEKYIRSVSSDDRIVLIVSGHYGQHLVPKIYQLRQIYSIYIYCANKQYHQQWSQHITKVKGVHNQLNDLIKQIQFDQSGRRKHKPDEPISISVFNSSNNSEQSTSALDGRFLQTQLLIECLLKMKITSTDKNEFIRHCRESYKGNNKTLQVVNEFEADYTSEHCLWWYARESFLYKMLNKALRIQNIDLLFLFRFFIRDIQRELHRHRHRLPVHVYRGQLMSREELDLLKSCKDQLISINSFLSTSINSHVALTFLGDCVNDDMLERVFFEIEADPCEKGVKPFADLSKFSQFPEDEILMTLGSVFRLNNIYVDDKQIWHIEMNLCSENDSNLQGVFYHMKNQYGLNNARLLLFGNVLIDMANFDDAEKYLVRLLKQLPLEHKDIYKCYHALGKVSCEKGNYPLSLYYLNKSIKILEKNELYDCRIGYVYNNLGEVYQKKGDIKEALESYEKGLKIFKLKFNDNDENIAWSYNNLGIIYQDQKNYSKAIYYLNKALDIKRKLLPPQHPCISNTYNNIGNIHYYLHEYDQALEKYQLSYEIFTKSLTPQHPSRARLLKNIGIVYEAKGDFIEAMKNYEKANSIREKVLSSSHPDLIEIKEYIARVLLKI